MVKGRAGWERGFGQERASDAEQEAEVAAADAAFRSAGLEPGRSHAHSRPKLRGAARRELDLNLGVLATGQLRTDYAIVRPASDGRALN